MRRVAVACVLALTLGAASHSNAPGTLPIQIVINGDALPLRPPPRFANGSLLVPVRRTIEALGLAFNRLGNVIWTQIGSKTVSLTIGSRVAHVDGERMLLDAPPVEFKDVLYAPLRFFTDVLGAQATFDRQEYGFHRCATCRAILRRDNADREADPTLRDGLRDRREFGSSDGNAYR